MGFKKRKPYKTFKGKTKRNYIPKKTKIVKKRVTKGVFKNQKMLYILSHLTSFILFALLAGVFLVIVVVAIFSVDLPNPNRLLERDAELSTRILAKDGTPIYEVFGEKNRAIVKLEDVSPDLLHATLAAEDSNFYQHKGYSLRGMARAVLNTVTGSGLQGGSTVTQQVVKNALLSQERTITRKIKEAILSLQLENRYTKDEIFQMYLNETPYGGPNYGVMTASKAYFDKDPSELSIAESAFLAGLPQRPSFYSPYSSDPKNGLERKDYVLYLMNERGWLDAKGVRHYLNDEDYELAKKEEVTFKAAASSFEAPHFVFYVKELLEEQFGDEVVEQQGLQVITTLDLDLQKTAQEIVESEVDASVGMRVGNGALIAIDPQTGHILAMVGSKNYFADPYPEGCASGKTGEGSCMLDPNVNVTTSQRQPGSSIKPITYATMLSQGYTASFPLLDVKTKFVGEGVELNKFYEPQNYDGKFRGPKSLRKSLGNSLNVPAVKALKMVGIDTMMETAAKMGITTFKKSSNYGLSLTLGGGETRLLEMTGAFSTFAAKGIHRDPVAILEIRDAHGKVLYKWQDDGGNQVLDEEVAFLISDILSDDGARSEVFGFGSLLNVPGHQVAVKTGTTDDKRDNYYMAFTPELSVGVWVGNSNNEPMDPYIASGITGATPIGSKFVKEFLKDKEQQKFEIPEKVKKIEVDELTGMLPFKDYPKRPEWFIEGTEPTTTSDWYQELRICKVDNLLANDECKDADRDKEITFVKIRAEIPEWQGYVDAWVADNHEDSKYFPPQTVSQLRFNDDDPKGMNPKITIVGLSDGSRVPLTFRFDVEVSASDDIDEVNIYLDGERVTSDKSFPYGYNFEFLPNQAGSHEIRVKAKDKDDRDSEKTIRVIVE